LAKLFLSYSRKDAAKAQRLCDWLEREGHEVWRDEDDIGGGASFSAEIENALKECDAVVVLWSASSVQSAWVRDEAGFGRDANKLIPLTLDSTESPLGFRQFQSIDVSRWKAQSPAADRVANAIARVTGAAGQSPALQARAVRQPRRLFSLPKIAAAVAILVLLGAAVGLLLWRNSSEYRGISIAVMASPTSPDRITATDYANVTAADMAAFLPTHFDGATVIPPSDANGITSGNRMLISFNPHGKGADASLTLSDADGRSIIWSKSWSVSDLSALDLREEISRFATRGALCLTDAKGGSERLTRPALDLYVRGCVGMIDSTWSPDQLSSTFERVVALAPEFPPGWSYVAATRSFLAADENSSEAAHRAAVTKARDAIATARRLNPSSGLTYLAEATLIQDDRIGSLALLDKGVAVEPTNAMVQWGRSDVLGSVGRLADSVQAAKRAVELDPITPDTWSQYILALTYAGQFSRAQTVIADARKKWPHDPTIEFAEFGYQYRYGDPRVAEQLVPRVLDYSDVQLVPYRQLIAARLDPSPAKVEIAINSWKTATGSDPGRYLLALGQFHKVEEILAMLGNPKVWPNLDPAMFFRPEFAAVRADPRFMAVAARAGLVRYWRQSGKWPDYCSSEQLQYDCKTEAAKYPG